jgi:hypothetical protein
MSGVEVQREGAWSIATAPGRSCFMAWAKMGRITGTSPINEPGEHVWFEFGSTRQEAADKLRRDLGLMR